jgi:hypothetical protein
MEQRQPTIFLSSTFYDLRQVRADLRDFVENQLGYRLLASEFASFPVDPTIETIENCRKRVEQDADIFLLVIGGRYGSVPSGSDKSVTNLEYLSARGKRIPIFVFVLRDILAVLPVWQSNPHGDFSRVADSTKLFGFIEEIRTSERVWTFPFDTAQQIVETLRAQLAYRMSEALRLMARLDQGSDLAELSGKALRFALERSAGWPGKVLAALIDDELRIASDLRRDHALGLAIGVGEKIAEDRMSAWLEEQTSHVTRVIAALEVVVNRLLNNAFDSNDVGAIRHGAKQIGTIYRDCLEWAARIRRTRVPDDWKPTVAELWHMLDDVIAEVEVFSARMLTVIEKALDESSDGLAIARVAFKVSIANADRCQAEIKKLNARRARSISAG